VSKHLAIPGILALVVLSSAAPAAAQGRSAVSGAELEKAVLARSAQQTGNQETVQRFVRTEAVRQQAARMGVNSEDLAAKVATLDAATLSDLAERTRAADQQLAGGDTIVISATVVIIVLLIIILILVAD
jgi:hypothetical protein